MAFHVPRSGIQGMMKKGTRYMDGKEDVVYDSIATIKGNTPVFYKVALITRRFLKDNCKIVDLTLTECNDYISIKTWATQSRQHTVHLA